MCTILVAERNERGHCPCVGSKVTANMKSLKGARCPPALCVVIWALCNSPRVKLPTHPTRPLGRFNTVWVTPRTEFNRHCLSGLGAAVPAEIALWDHRLAHRFIICILRFLSTRLLQKYLVTFVPYHGLRQGYRCVTAALRLW